jgi:hypothetical protein
LLIVTNDYRMHIFASCSHFLKTFPSHPSSFPAFFARSNRYELNLYTCQLGLLVMWLRFSGIEAFQAINGWIV